MEKGVYIVGFVGFAAILTLFFISGGSYVELPESTLVGQAARGGWDDFSPRFTKGIGETNSDGGVCNTAMCEECVKEAMEDAQIDCNGRNTGNCYTNTYEAYVKDCKKTKEVSDDCIIEDWWTGDTPTPVCGSKTSQRGRGDSFRLKGR